MNRDAIVGIAVYLLLLPALAVAGLYLGSGPLGYSFGPVGVVIFFIGTVAGGLLLGTANPGQGRSGLEGDGGLGFEGEFGGMSVGSNYAQVPGRAQIGLFTLGAGIDSMIVLVAITR